MLTFTFLFMHVLSKYAPSTARYWECRNTISYCFSLSLQSSGMEDAVAISDKPVFEIL